jgi:hypothetical protein
MDMQIGCFYREQLRRNDLDERARRVALDAIEREPEDLFVF